METDKAKARRQAVRLRALRIEWRKWSSDHSWEGRYQRVWVEKEIERVKQTEVAE